MSFLGWGKSQKDEQDGGHRSSGFAKHTLRTRRISKRDSPGTIPGFSIGPSASPELPPRPVAITRKRLPAGPSASTPQSTYIQPSQPEDGQTSVAGPVSGGSPHPTQASRPQLSGSMPGPVSTEKESENPANFGHAMSDKSVTDNSIIAAAEAHFKQVQQLQEQVATFKHEAGRNEEAIRDLTENIDRMVAHAELQADNVKELQQENADLRGSQERLEQERKRHFDRATGLSEAFTQTKRDRDYWFNEARDWQRKFDNVNQKGSKSKNRVVELTHELGQLKISLHQARREAEKVEGLNAKVDGLNAQVAKQKQQEQVLQFDVQQQQEAVRSLEQDLDQCRSRIILLETQLGEHKKEIEKMDEQLVQSTSAFPIEPEIATPVPLGPPPAAPSEDSRWMPEADFDISRKFDSLWQDLTSWSKMYARKRNLDLRSLAEVDLQHLQGRLEPAMARSGDGTTALSSLSAMGHKGPSVMLATILANELYTAFFNNPFFFMSEQGSPPRTTYVPGKEDLPDTTMAAFFSALRDDDPEAANEWRVQMIRSLHSSVIHRSGTQPNHLHERLQAGREVSIHSFTRSFLDSLPAVLVDTQDSNNVHRRYEDLAEIVSEAAELALRLSTQKDQVRVQRMQDLSQAGRPIRFHARSSTLQHHALHNLQLEDAEHSLDGRQILLVVHPLILAFSSKADNSRTSERVWKRAIVWMGV